MLFLVLLSILNLQNLLAFVGGLVPKINVSKAFLQMHKL